MISNYTVAFMTFTQKVIIRENSRRVSLRPNRCSRRWKKMAMEIDIDIYIKNKKRHQKPNWPSDTLQRA